MLINTKKAKCAKRFANRFSFEEKNIINKTLPCIINNSLLFFTKIHMFFLQHKLFSYACKRIIYGIVILFVAIASIFLLYRFNMDLEVMFSPPPELIQAWIRAHRSEIEIARFSKNYIDFRMNNSPFLTFGTSRVFEEIFLYMYRICPLFLKKNDIIDLNSLTVVGSTYTLCDFGTISALSLSPGDSVLELTFERMLTSFYTGILGIIISYVVAVPIGIEISRRKGSKVDSSINILAMILYALPSIAIAVIVSLLFVLPPDFDKNDAFLYIPPTIAIVVMFVPSIIISVRRYTCDEAINDYIKFASSNGLSSIRQYYVHVFRVSGVKILRGFPSQIIYAMIGVSFYTETVFGIEGFSRLSLQVSDSQNTYFFDMNVLLCTTTIAALFTVVAWTLSDILASILDPRIKFAK